MIFSFSAEASNASRHGLTVSLVALGKFQLIKNTQKTITKLKPMFKFSFLLWTEHLLSLKVCTLKPKHNVTDMTAFGNRTFKEVIKVK